MKKIVVTVGVILFFCGVASAQAKRFAVYVSISADSAIFQDVDGYFARELRALGDVDVTTEANLTIRVLAFKVRSKAAGEVGYAIAYSFAESRICDGDTIYQLLDTGLQTGDINSLPWLSKQIVKDFDSFILEKRRTRRGR